MVAQATARGVSMTIWDVLGLARRYAIVALLGLGVTAWFTLQAWDQPGAYRSQVNVRLLPPPAPTGNALIDTTDSLTSTAGVVVRMVGGPTGTAGSVSSTVSLAGEGVVRGHSIRQQNVGGQWEQKFVDPVLDLQSVGPTKDAAAAEMDVALSSVSDALDTLEDRAGVAPDARIRVELSPSTPVVAYAHGSRTRSVAATLLLGAIATAAAVLAVDHLTRRRRRRRRPRRAPELVPLAT